MSGDVGSLTVELCPITGCGLNHTAVYSIQGNQAQFWQKTADIPVADCDDFIVRIYFFHVAFELSMVLHKIGYFLKPCLNFFGK